MRGRLVNSTVCKATFLCVTVFFSLVHTVRSEQGDGTEGNPIYDRLEPKTAVMFREAASSFQALFRDIEKKPNPEEFVRSFAADEDLTKFKASLPHFEQFRSANGELVLDSKKQGDAGVRKVTYYVVEEDLPLSELELIF